MTRLLNAAPHFPLGIAQLPGHTGGVAALRFDAANRLLLALTHAGAVVAHDHATARTVGAQSPAPPAASFDFAPAPAAPAADAGQGTLCLLALASSTGPCVTLTAIDSGAGPLAEWAQPPKLAPRELAALPPHPPGAPPPLLPPPTARLARFSPSGSLLALALSDGSVALFDVASGVRSSVLPGSPQLAPLHAAFSPDGQTLALARCNGTLAAWTLRHLDPLQLVWLLDGRRARVLPPTGACDPHQGFAWGLLRVSSGMALRLCGQGRCFVASLEASRTHRMCCMRCRRRGCAGRHPRV